MKKIPVGSAEPDMVMVGNSVRGKLPACRIVSLRPALEGEDLGVLDGDYLIVFDGIEIETWEEQYYPGDVELWIRE